MPLFRISIEHHFKTRLFFIVTVISITIFNTSAHTKVKKNVSNNYHITSIQMHKTGWELSYPVLVLGSSEKLEFSFDDISNNQKNFYYKIELCNADWSPANLYFGDYIEGFQDNPFNEINSSFNTKQQYWHYSTPIPNDDIILKLSGNYRVLVYDYNNPDSILFKSKFFVVSNLVNLNGKIKDTRVNKIPMHRLNFKISPNSPQVNRDGQLFVDVYQNFRHDRKISHIESSGYEQDSWMFDDYAKIEFPAGREFFQFEMKDFKFKSYEVADIYFKDTIQHIILKPIIMYAPYDYHEDINGRFYVKYDKAYDRNLDSDYGYVKFNIKCDYNLPDYQLYVVGEFNNWLPTQKEELIYNPATKIYEQSILLKQGLYNYDIAIEPDDYKGYPFEQRVEAEQDYLVFIYYRDFYDDYDRLIGFYLFNSLHNRVIGEFY